MNQLYPVRPIKSVVIGLDASGVPSSPSVIFHDKVRDLENAGAFGVAYAELNRKSQVSVPTGSSSTAVGAAGSDGNVGANSTADPAGVLTLGGGGILSNLPNPVRFGIIWGLPIAAVILLLKGHEIGAIAMGAAALYVWKPAVVGPMGAA